MDMSSRNMNALHKKLIINYLVYTNTFFVYFIAIGNREKGVELPRYLKPTPIENSLITAIDLKYLWTRVQTLFVTFIYIFTALTSTRSICVITSFLSLCIVAMWLQ